jgi:D-glycero-D-manno-heptose 1,7-bisphosphate phosphatase
MTPAVFLDRDGTLVEEAGYLDRIERLVLFPWSIDAVRLLNRGGFKVVVLSNQAGIARGFFDEALVNQTHRYLDERLAAGGARIDGYYYCPHHPDAMVPEYKRECDCRKPQPGMARAAAAALDLDLARSWMVGDRWLDVQLGQAVGARTVLVRSGYGRTEEARPKAGVTADAIVDRLIEAVALILWQTR